MKINLAIWDRVIRFILGTLLSIWAFAGGPWWTFLGLYLMFTSGWGFCLVYSLFNFRTAQIDDHRFLP
jgi:hypothetical protein